MQDRLLTAREVAEWLSVDEATVHKMARQGRLPVAKIGRKYRFRKSDLEEWFDQQKNGTNGH